MGAGVDGEVSSDESGTAVAISSDGTKLATGSPFHDGSGTNIGHVRVFSNPYVGINDKIISNYSVYPNPSNEIFTILFTENTRENYLCEIYNNLGELIQSETISNNMHNLNLSNYPAGFYFLKITNNKEAKTQKIIITN